MALNTIAGMEAAVSDWTNAGLTATQTRDLITLGEDRIYRELRVRDMEASTSVAIASGVVAVPADYIEMIDARIDATPVRKLQRKTTDWIYENFANRTATGIPLYIAREGANFIFGPDPDSSYTLILRYYARPATAVAGTLAGIVESAPGLLLFSALAESEPYLGRDQRIVVWEQKYQFIKNLVESQDMDENFSGADLTVTPS